MLDEAEYIDRHTSCKVGNLPMKSMGTAAADGIICGGFTFDQGINGVARPNSACVELNTNGTWTNIEPMLERRAYFTLTKISDIIIAIGGLGPERSRSVESRFSKSDSVWSFRKNSPITLLEHCTIQLNTSHLMVLGGRGQKNYIVNTRS